MTDAQIGRGDVTQAGAGAQPGDGKSLLEHSGWLDHLKHGATTFGHKAAGIVHKGVEEGEAIAHDPTTKQVAHEVAQAGREVGEDHVRKVQSIANAAKHHDLAGAARAAAPLVGEVLLPHVTAANILKDKGAEIAEKHASPKVRAEIEKAKAQSDQISQKRNPHIPQLVIDGLTTDQTVRH